MALSAGGNTIAAGEPCAGTGGQAVIYTEPRGPSTCTVTVSDPVAGAITPTGTVSFSSNGGSAGSFDHGRCKLKAISGKVRAGRCTVTFTPTSALAYTITARYGGDVHHLPGSDVTVVRTSILATSITVGCSPSSVRAGATSSCTAIAAALGAQRVDITFKLSGGSAGSEQCRTDKTSEICTVPFSAASAGSYTVIAEYPGDAGHAPSSAHAMVTVVAH